MENVRTLLGSFRDGYRDGWESVPFAGPSPSLILTPPRLVWERESLYKSGYQCGRADAKQGNVRALMPKR